MKIELSEDTSRGISSKNMTKVSSYSSGITATGISVEGPKAIPSVIKHKKIISLTKSAQLIPKDIKFKHLRLKKEIFNLEKIVNSKNKLITNVYRELAVLTKMLESNCKDYHDLLDVHKKEKEFSNRIIEDKEKPKARDLLLLDSKETLTTPKSSSKDIEYKYNQINDVKDFELAELTFLLEEKDLEISRLKTLASGSDCEDKHGNANFSIISALKSKFLQKFKEKFEIRVLINSVLFDAKWYLKKYPDIAENNFFSRNAENHYLKIGGFEDRNPGPNFSSQGYLDLNPDAANSGMNPLIHYLRYGINEGRLPSNK